MFVLEHLVDLRALRALPGFGHADRRTVSATLGEAGLLFSETVPETNLPGDVEGCRFDGGAIFLPEGLRDSYHRMVEGGWLGLSLPVRYGGSELPLAVHSAVGEMMASANASLAMLPGLGPCAAELLLQHASEAQKDRYLRRLAEGDWSATVCVTEREAGSDLGRLRTRAERDADGSYRIFGTKTFITFGEHDVTDNTLHLVLARTPNAPAGAEGISLFIVPKREILDDGALGERNDVRCVSISHKLGVRASPTCELSFGDAGRGARGHLLGEEGAGLSQMSALMDMARLAVGISGLGIGERAYQRAVAFSKGRIQGSALGPGGPAPVPIIRHPDVRRMLMTMRSQLEAVRALLYATAGLLDRARRHPDPESRQRAQQRAELLVPVAKAWSTEVGHEVASLAIQVFGATGYEEESGIPQLFRDSRAGAIQLGTNGIQALDLVGRKLAMPGLPIRELIEEMAGTARRLGRFEAAEPEPAADLAAIGRALLPAVEGLEEATLWILENGPHDPEGVAAGASPYQRMLGTVTGAFLLARSAVAANVAIEAGQTTAGERAFLRGKISSARFFAEQALPCAAALIGPITAGAQTLFSIPEDDWAA